MTSVNANNKSSHVASNFAAICRDFRRSLTGILKNSFMVVVA